MTRVGRLFRRLLPARSATPTETIRPLIGRDFPDPDVVAVGDRYYAYSTNSWYDGRLVNVPVWQASALGGPWAGVGDALPELPRWVADAGHGGSHLWAPDVVPAPGGGYLLYFTAHHARDRVQCLGVAAGPGPAGPFRGVGDDALVVRPRTVTRWTPQCSGHRTDVATSSTRAAGPTPPCGCRN